MGALPRMINPPHKLTSVESRIGIGAVFGVASHQGPLTLVWMDPSGAAAVVKIIGLVEVPTASIVPSELTQR